MPPDNNELLRNLQRLASNLKNPKTKNDAMREGGFSEVFYQELQNAVDCYITNINTVENSTNDELIFDITSSLKKLLQLTESLINGANITNFINEATVLIDSAPKNTNENTDAIDFNITINREEFEKRYDELVSRLNDHTEEQSNLILETKDKRRYKLFRQNTRHGNIIVSKPVGHEYNTSPLNKEDLARIASHGGGSPTQLERLLIEKISDNSIFDFITTSNNAQDKDLINALNEKSKRLEGEITVLKETIEKYQNIYSDLEAFQSEANNAKTEFQNAKETALTDLHLATSHEYWNGRASKGKWFFIGYSVASIVVSVIGLYLLFNHLQSHLKNEQPFQGLVEYYIIDHLWVYTFLIFATSLGVWILRILIRLTLSNYHIYVDAEERVVMIKTYLALTKEGQALENNDKELILKALFRGTSFGVIKDEFNMLITETINKKS